MIPQTMGTENVTYVAKFTPIEYEVKFTADGQPYETVELIFGAQITKPETDPSKANYVFGGWAYSTAPDTAVTFPQTMPGSAVEFVAIFTPATTCTVTYKSDYGTAPEAVTVNIGVSTTVASAIAAEGYVFAGWRIEGKDTVIEAGASHAFEADTTLVAVWKKSVTGSVKVARVEKTAKNLAQISVYGKDGAFVETKAIEAADTATDADGVFEFEILLSEGEYTAVITKSGHLDAKVSFTVGANGGEIALVDLSAGAGDVVKDGSIDLADFVEIVRTFDDDASAPTDAELAKCDINEDGAIDVKDLGWIQLNYGKKLETGNN